MHRKTSLYEYSRGKRLQRRNGNKFNAGVLSKSRTGERPKNRVNEIDFLDPEGISLSIFITNMRRGLAIGAKKYGLKGFLKNSPIRMMKEELRDVANYAFMLYMWVDAIEKGILTSREFRRMQ